MVFCAVVFRNPSTSIGKISLSCHNLLEYTKASEDSMASEVAGSKWNFPISVAYDWKPEHECKLKFANCEISEILLLVELLIFLTSGMTDRVENEIYQSCQKFCYGVLDTCYCIRGVQMRRRLHLHRLSTRGHTEKSLLPVFWMDRQRRNFVIKCHTPNWRTSIRRKRGRTDAAQTTKMWFQNFAADIV